MNMRSLCSIISFVRSALVPMVLILWVKCYELAGSLACIHPTHMFLSPFFILVFSSSSFLISYKNGFHDAILVWILLFVPFVAMLFEYKSLFMLHTIFGYVLISLKTRGCVFILPCALHTARALFAVYHFALTASTGRSSIRNRVFRVGVMHN